MLEFPVECVLCGEHLKKQVIRSNVFYYCSRCGSISSIISAESPSQI